MNYKALAMCLLGLFVFSATAQAEPGEAAEKKIEWCRLQHPGSVTVQAKEKSDFIYGQVFIPGCSEGEKVCKDVRAEACIAPKGAPEKQVCFPAKNNPKFRTDTNNDEYMVQIAYYKPGEYHLLYQFSIDDGRNWVKCDFDDDHGFDYAKAGSFIVTE